MDTYLRGDTDTFHCESIRQPVASRVLASSSLLSAPLRALATPSPMLQAAIPIYAVHVSRVNGTCTMRRSARLHCTTVTRGVTRSRCILWKE